MPEDQLMLERLQMGSFPMEDLQGGLRSSLLIICLANLWMNKAKALSGMISDMVNKSERVPSGAGRSKEWEFTTFAAIDIGSYEVSMRIFELSKRIGFRELDDVRFRLEPGKTVYSTGTLSMEMVDSICEVLIDFKRIMSRVRRGRMESLCYQCIP